MQVRKEALNINKPRRGGASKIDLLIISNFLQHLGCSGEIIDSRRHCEANKSVRESMARMPDSVLWQKWRNYEDGRLLHGLQRAIKHERTSATKCVASKKSHKRQ
jgi:hypothetical protein